MPEERPPPPLLRMLPEERLPPEDPPKFPEDRLLPDEPRKLPEERLLPELLYPGEVPYDLPLLAPEFWYDRPG